MAVSASQPVRLFVGSSSEGREVAHNLQAVLEGRAVCEVEVWDQGVFEPSGYALDSLLDVAARSDFAVLVASPEWIATRAALFAALAPFPEARAAVAARLAALSGESDGG